MHGNAQCFNHGPELMHAPKLVSKSVTSTRPAMPRGGISDSIQVEALYGMAEPDGLPAKWKRQQFCYTAYKSSAGLDFIGVKSGETVHGTRMYNGVDYKDVEVEM